MFKNWELAVYCIAMVQFYPWFKFDTPIFYIHYYALKRAKRKGT